MTHNTPQPDPYDQTRIGPASTPTPGQYGGPPPVEPYRAQSSSTPAQPGQNPYATPPAYYGQAPHYPPQNAPAAAGPVSTTVRIIGWMLAGFASITVIAAFLPWLTIGETSVNGLGDSEYGAKDGMITLVLAVVAGVFGVASAVIAKRSAMHLVAGIVAVVMGLSILGTAIIDIADISDYEAFGIEVGYGLWLTVLGGIGVLIAGFAAIVKRT